MIACGKVELLVGARSAMSSRAQLSPQKLNHTLPHALSPRPAGLLPKLTAFKLLVLIFVVAFSSSLLGHFAALKSMADHEGRAKDHAEQWAIQQARRRPPGQSALAAAVGGGSGMCLSDASFLPRGVLASECARAFDTLEGLEASNCPCASGVGGVDMHSDDYRYIKKSGSCRASFEVAVLGDKRYFDVDECWRACAAGGLGFPPRPGAETSVSTPGLERIGEGDVGQAGGGGGTSGVDQVEYDCTEAGCWCYCQSGCECMADVGLTSTAFRAIEKTTTTTTTTADSVEPEGGASKPGRSSAAVAAMPGRCDGSHRVAFEGDDPVGVAEIDDDDADVGAPVFFCACDDATLATWGASPPAEACGHLLGPRGWLQRTCEDAGRGLAATVGGGGGGDFGASAGFSGNDGGFGGGQCGVGVARAVRDAAAVCCSDGLAGCGVGASFSGDSTVFAVSPSHGRNAEPRDVPLTQLRVGDRVLVSASAASAQASGEAAAAALLNDQSSHVKGKGHKGHKEGKDKGKDKEGKGKEDTSAASSEGSASVTPPQVFAKVMALPHAKSGGNEGFVEVTVAGGGGGGGGGFEQVARLAPWHTLPTCCKSCSPDAALAPAGDKAEAAAASVAAFAAAASAAVLAAADLKVGDCVLTPRGGAVVTSAKASAASAWDSTYSLVLEPAGELGGEGMVVAVGGVFVHARPGPVSRHA